LLSHSLSTPAIPLNHATICLFTQKPFFAAETSNFTALTGAKLGAKRTEIPIIKIAIFLSMFLKFLLSTLYQKGRPALFGRLFSFI